MDSKLLQFIDHKGSSCELWGDLSETQVRLTGGIANAFADEKVCYISFYEPVGLAAGEVEIKRLTARLAVPVHLLPVLASQLASIATTFGSSQAVASPVGEDAEGLRAEPRTEGEPAPIVLGDRLF